MSAMLSPVKTPIERFSNRVGFYERYPDAALAVLGDVLRPDSVLADIGSGTGISSRWLLRRSSRVYAVEPNDAMRERSREQPGLIHVNGTAEATGLADASVDAVVCATAFHWFDVDAARREFARILRPRENVVLLWNIRKRAASALQEGYEQLIAEFATDYQPQWVCRHTL